MRAMDSVWDMVRMAERSKALRSGRSPLLWAWVRIPLLTRFFFVLSLILHRCDDVTLSWAG